MLTVVSTKFVLRLASVAAILSAGQATAQQTLKMRGGMLTAKLQAMYASPAFDQAYQDAAASYDASMADNPHVYAVWNSRKPLVWLQNTEKDILAYSVDFTRFKHQLDVASEDPLIVDSPAKAAQISQIQNRLTTDNLNTLNVMIKTIDLGALLTGNRKPETAKLWTQRQLPDDRHILDESKMGDVPRFLEEINTCLTESGKDHVQFGHSASFSWNVPKDADDKPLNREQSLIYWQWHNHAPVDTAVAKLYNSLHKAQSAAIAEGLPVADSPLPKH